MRGESSTKGKLKENKTREGLAYGNSNGIQPEDDHQIGSAFPKWKGRENSQELRFRGKGCIVFPWSPVIMQLSFDI